MNIVDIAIVTVFVLFVLLGLYKGFLSNALGVGAYIMSWLLAMLFMAPAANAVKANQTIYNMMLYYTEGSEYIGDIDIARTGIGSIGTDELSEILADAELPYPMAKRISANVATEAFSELNVSTLGDYFNQTIVCVFINILVFLALFFMIRLIFAFFINGVDYAYSLPRLRNFDALLGAAVGIIRGVLALFLVFMLLPIVLTVLGKIDFVTGLIDGSFFTNFFYRSNFLLGMMPGV